MGLTTQQRRDRILARICEQGTIEVRALAGELGVSEATMRRDLRSLADEKQVELVYGGASLPRPSDYSIRSRSMLNVEEKRVVGRLAAGLVEDREHIFMDSGSTCFEMTHHLKRKRGLSIVTHSTRLAIELGGAGDASVIQIGGHYRPERMDTVGPLAVYTIDQLRGYLAFFGSDGVSTEFGVTARDIEMAHLYQHVIRNARETILLVDHTKFRVPSLYRICGWDQISRVVTDREPPAPWREFLEEKGIDILCPAAAEGDAPAAVAG